MSEEVKLDGGEGFAPPAVEVEKEVIRAEEPESESVATADFSVCPHCGLRSDFPVVDEPTDEDKLKWSRFCCGKVRFTKQFSLFKGKLKLTFRARFMRETDAVKLHMSNLIATGVLSDLPHYVNPEYSIELYKSFVAFSLQKLEFFSDSGNPQIKEFDQVQVPSRVSPKEISAIIDARIAELGDMSEGTIAAILDTQKRFEMLTLSLMRRSKDPNFS